jgi:hypothetical protein
LPERREIPDTLAMRVIIQWSIIMSTAIAPSQERAIKHSLPRG